MNRIKIALLSTVLILPGAAALAQDDRGVVKADPTYSDDTMAANSPSQDVIETRRGDDGRLYDMDGNLVDEMGNVIDEEGNIVRRRDDDRGVVRAEPGDTDDTLEAQGPTQDVIETPGG